MTHLLLLKFLNLQYSFLFYLFVFLNLHVSVSVLRICMIISDHKYFLDRTALHQMYLVVKINFTEKYTHFSFVPLYIARLISQEH